MKDHPMQTWRSVPQNRANENARRRETYDPVVAQSYRERYEGTHREEILNRKREAYDPIRARVFHIKAKYGLSLVGWLSLFFVQGEKCACCGSTTPGGKRWHTDHDHANPEPNVRGILCHHCNLMLGAARDRVDRLAMGQRYLEDRS